ncbi:MAG: hypothetical protein M0R51_17615, partial [Clostridia bacterium]|nr:hypothetical protein [Clostridia bacterium]
ANWWRIKMDTLQERINKNCEERIELQNKNCLNISQRIKLADLEFEYNNLLIEKFKGKKI